MALANRRTTLLLVGIAVVFTIVLIILCLTPPSRRPRDTGHHEYFEQGKSHSTTPKGIIIETDPPTTSAEPTTTARTTRTSTTEITTTQSSTTETSTTEPESPDVFATTTEDYIYYNESSSRETLPTTQSESNKTTSATTTTTQEQFTTTGSSYSDESTETNYDDTWVSTSTESTTESSVLPGGETESTNETITTLSDTTSTTLQERNETTLADTTTEELVPADTTTEEVIHTDSTTEGVILVETTTEEGIHTETTTEGVIRDDMTTEAETTTEELIPDDTTTEEEMYPETTTEEEIPEDATTEASTEAETSVPETTTDGTTLEETTPTSTTPETMTTTPRSTEVATRIAMKVNETECRHPDCKELAARMLDMMDHHASPCKDFYQYACGGVEDDPFLHPEDPEKDVNDRILRALQSSSINSIGVAEPAREFFKSCIEKPAQLSEADLSQLRELVSRHGQLDPRVIEGVDEMKYAFIDEDAFDLQKMLADFIKYDFAPFFEVGLDVDKIDRTKFSVRLSLPLNGYDSGFSESIETWHCKGMYKKDLQEAVQERKNLDATTEYNKLQRCRVKGLGHAQMIASLKRATKALNLTDHIDNATLASRLLDETAFNAEFFIGEIKDAWPDFNDLRHQLINKNYKEYNVADLDSGDLQIKQVKWSELLHTIVGRPVDKVQVYHEHELMGVLKRMSEEKDVDLRNMLLMLWANRLYSDLVVPATSAEYCASVTRYLAPDMAAVMYLESFPKADLDLMKEKVERVVNNVKNTVTAALNLTHGVSQELLDKFHYTVSEVGGAQNLDLLTESVSSSTQELPLNATYVARSLVWLQRRRKDMYSFLGNDTDSHTSLWNHFSVPYSTTATTLYGTNTILIPEGVMAPPLMYPALAALPNYLLYAGIGHLVAHEFLHAIDTTGIKYDSFGAKREGELQRPPLMDARENCLLQFLNINFTLPMHKTSLVSFQLPDNLHLNELMADSGATRLAWLAYIHGETAKARKPMAIVTDAPSRRRRRSVPSTDSHELPLPWLDMTPYQLYLLRTAQTQCARTSDIDAVAIMEREHLPARLRVNLAMVNEPLFAEAFNCPVVSMMRATNTCPFVISHMPDE